MIRKSAFVAALIAAGPSALSQSTSDSPLAPARNGVRVAQPSTHVFTGITLHPAPGVRFEDATLLINDGRVVVAREGEVDGPPGSRVHELDGMHIYPAFIDAWVEVDAPTPDDDAAGLHWNDAVTPHRSVLDGDGISEDAKMSHRAMGFGAAAIVPEGGVFAGRAAAVSLAEKPDDPSAEHEAVYAEDVFHAIDFETGGYTAGYPTSHPGAVALMRQTLSDADWQADNRNGPPNALTPLESPVAPLAFDCALELEPFLAADVAGEFDRAFILIGSGKEYKWIDGIAEATAASATLVTPLRFPAKPDVSTVGRANALELERMMEWEQAPAGPGRLTRRGVELAITATLLPEGRSFFAELRKAIEHGLSASDALAALTTVPAETLGIADQVGTLEPGKRASFIVASGPMFDEDTTIHDVWIDGRRHAIKPHPRPGVDGVWTLTLGDPNQPRAEVTLTIKGTSGSKPKPSIEIQTDREVDVPKVDARDVSFTDGALSFLFDDPNTDRVFIFSGTVAQDGGLRGAAFTPDQEVVPWAAERTAAEEDEQDEADSQAETDDTPDPAPHPGYPFGPYARQTLPPQTPILIINATVWSQGPDGTLENGYVHADRGTIRAVGSMPTRGGLPVRVDDRTRVIDARGRHVTPGLIDAHSHTSLFRMGVNEAGEAVTAEVRIRDSLDPSHINWYRQLAHGVTSVLSLHGSANPIGGQSQITKVRWGSPAPSGMFMEDARPGVKFALGENVKRSNWGPRRQTRYPASRMGVEALIRDRLTAAKEYAAARGSGQPPRRDLELEALAEVVAGDRLIHCHSYRQDEILMLARVAEDFGFTIGTFTHGLEVYKVPEAVRENALGASLFSDWWAYKMEVQDAIPYAGPLQTEAGVLTSYNSDSDELARRMNLEAAKALKYARRTAGGEPALTQEDALAFVTINPAIQLGIDDRVGSLEPGKDADLVVWSGDPLSSLSNVHNVFIDGAEYFSITDDQAMRDRIQSERERLIRKIAEAGQNDTADDSEPDPGRADPDAPDPVDVPTQRRMLAELYNVTERDFPEYPEPGECGCGMILHRASERGLD